MLFNSFTFIFIFLPAVLLIFVIAGRFGLRAALVWLISASFLFYAAYQPRDLWLPVLSLCMNFALAQWIVRSVGGSRLSALWLGVAANIALLGWFKVEIAGLLFERTSSASFSTTTAIIVPLAISFITFQQIAFLVDVHRGRVQKPEPLPYAFFILFFPQLVMGPIVHYREITRQLDHPDFLRLRTEAVAIGLAIFVIGLFKKVVLADGIAPFVNEVYSAVAAGSTLAWSDAWAAAIGFQFQVYFDFSGYADMAIGLGRLFNINLPINFDSPYRAVDRYDLWRRWHITFVQFMRSYVFIPLQRNRYLPIPGVAAMMLTVSLAGLWHGVGWTFALWGLVQGIILLWLHYYRNTMKAFGVQPSDIVPRWFRIALCFTVTCLIGVLFRSTDLTAAGVMYDALLLPDFSSVTSLALDVLRRSRGDLTLDLYRMGVSDGLLLLAMAGIVWGLPNTASFFAQYWTALDQRAERPARANGIVPRLEAQIRFSFSPLLAIAIATLLILAVLSLDPSNRFIYYQF